MQAFSFRAQSDSAVHFVIHRVIGLRATLIEPNNPQIFGFQILQCSGYVRDFCDWQVLACSGGDFRNCSGHADCAALGNDDAVCPRRICGAENCT